jgi:uncharacterized protein DUF3135
MEAKLKLSFDERVKMAFENPVAYESYRQKLIEDEIQRGSIRNQQKLKCMQFRIDMVRRRSNTPMASCLKVFTLMMDYFYGEHFQVVETCKVKLCSKAPENNNCRADIINFSGFRRSR